MSFFGGVKNRKLRFGIFVVLGFLLGCHDRVKISVAEERETPMVDDNISGEKERKSSIGRLSPIEEEIPNSKEEEFQTGSQKEGKVWKRDLCSDAYPVDKNFGGKNILRISRKQKCGEYFRLDDSVVSTDGAVFVEIQNLSNDILILGTGCDPVSYLSAVVVEGVNDKWDIGTGGGVLSRGCELPPKHAVQFSLDIRKGGNIAHPEAKAAIKNIKPGCYTARLATSGRLLPFKFELCITEKKS